MEDNTITWAAAINLYMIEYSGLPPDVLKKLRRVSAAVITDVGNTSMVFICFGGDGCDLTTLNEIAEALEIAKPHVTAGLQLCGTMAPTVTRRLNEYRKTPKAPGGK
jgi:hypothetical protein